MWNLLLGILDKATLTLGDNRRVDFSRAMIFMTSNLGAAEMGSILRPNLGFAAGEAERFNTLETVDGKLMDKISRAGVEAARRNFLPEFMNRIDRTVVFRPLGQAALRRILSIELGIVQQRILAKSQPFVFKVTDGGMEFLLREGRRSEVWRAAFEALNRTPPGLSAFESDRVPASKTRRSGASRFRFGSRRPGVLQGAIEVPQCNWGQRCASFPAGWRRVCTPASRNRRDGSA